MTMTMKCDLCGEECQDIFCDKCLEELDYAEEPTEYDEWQDFDPDC